MRTYRQFLILFSALAIGLSALPAAAQSSRNCSDLGIDIVEFEFAFNTAQQTMYDTYIAQQLDQAEAQQTVRDNYEDSRWTFCANGDLQISLYSEGSPYNTIEGTWEWSAKDGFNLFYAEYASNSTNGSTQGVIQGAIDENFEYAYVVREASNISAAVVYNQSFGSSTLAHAQFYVEFVEWKPPARPEMTKSDAARIIDNAFDQYSNVNVFDLKTCSGTGRWGAYAWFDYWDGFIGFWMPADDYFLIERQNDRYLVTYGQYC